ncbi:hypothetical protein NUW58_g1178 [Xylaria curta]|uniref:Uncharacterized protein n=1 Tax=Xylaria curta TaxID=42375 RepID=A0ACC1PPQ4_9PEZI|nr:hypothetical protein NUW58_g1178 [Xylaria curta]
MPSLHSLEIHGAAGKVLMDSATDMNYGNGPLASNERDRRDAKVGDDYTLMRDCDASSRLTAQHYLWKNLLGYLLHPDIPTPGKGWKIADIATGNGIWLQDLAENSPPSTELHGFDISLDQVGPTPWLQDNMHMHIWDVFEEPPPQFLGFFDIVHVRLLTVVVKNNDPRPLLKNITKLLKPGGYLQWGEVDTVGYSIKTVPGVAVENLRAIFSQLGGPDNWKPSFTEILDQNGYSGSALYTYEYGLGTARLWNDMYVGAWKELAERTLKTPELCDELELKVMEEVRNGAAIMAPKLVWIAQKV